jgi:hypothetical protein
MLGLIVVVILMVVLLLLVAFRCGCSRVRDFFRLWCGCGRRRRGTLKVRRHQLEEFGDVLFSATGNLAEENLKIFQFTTIIIIK